MNLGLGLALELQNGKFGSIYDGLIKSGATMILDPNRADGKKPGTNSPFVNPLVDIANKVGKNLFDPVTFCFLSPSYYRIASTGIESLALTDSRSWVNVANIKLKPNTVYRAKASNPSAKFVEIRNEAGAIFVLDNPTTLNQTFTTSASGLIGLKFNASGTDIQQLLNIMISEGTADDAYEPYARNNALLQNFIPSSADGYATIIAPNGKTVTVLNLDGTNSFGALASSDALNPVGSDDFAQLVVFKPDTTTTMYFGLGRNSDSGISTHQYGLITNDGSPRMFYIINGSSFEIVASNTDLQYVVYGRINGERFVVRNSIAGATASFNASIGTRPNTQLCCRSASVDGLTKAQFADGYLLFDTFWKAPNGQLDKAKIVAECAKFCAKQYGL
jgi:hypothetical protein